MRKQFYEKVLPSQGVYCVTGIKDGVARNRFAETLDELDQWIEDFKADQYNVFVALNTYNGHSRKSDYAAFCRSFFIDLDVGEDNPKKYGSKEEALAALDEFVKLADLPPPVRVDSGGGVHAYWPFDADVPSDEWRLYANKFKQLCLDHIKIDTTVTADAARVLRCPDTFNYKTTPPTEARLIDTEFYEYDFGLFKTYLGEVEAAPSDILAAIPKGLDDETRAIAKYDNYETLFQDIAEKSLNDQGCAQIKHILINSKTLSYDEWYTGLGIARHCEDWETAIHLLSEDYDGYDREQTIWKANQTLGFPRSCEFFASNWPSRCEGCQFRGRVANPLGIGRKLREAPTLEEADKEDTVRSDANSQEIPLFPAFLKPFVRGRAGGIYYQPPPKVDDEGNKVHQDPVLLSLNIFYPIKRMYGDSDGEVYVIKIVLPHETREKLLSMEAMQSPDEFKRTLGKAGIAPPHQSLWPKLMEYMMKWAHYLQSQNAADQVRMQMGWTEDNSAFVIGNSEFLGNNQKRKAASSPTIRSIAKLLRPNGDFDVWKKSANRLNEPDMEMHAFAMFLSFGSPLMRLMSTSGMSFCYTGLSGAAKSGALYGALSVWGAPKEQSIYDTTDNAFNSRAMTLKNIFMGMDEIHDKDPEDIAKLIHFISQGKGKMRMHASINAERELQFVSSLLCLMTSNISLYDKIFTKKANASGEIMRLLEYVIVQPPHMTMNVGRDIFDPFRTNYGYAGEGYVDRLLSMGDSRILKYTTDWTKRITATKLGSNAAFRFYEDAFAASFAGTQIAMEAGIVNFDIERIYDRVILETLRVRDKTNKTAQVDYEGLITEFMDAHWTSGVLILNEGAVISEPRGGALVARIEIHTSMQYISKTEFRKFLASRSVGTAEFEKAMEKTKLNLETKKMRLSTGWKAGMVTPPIHVYAFKSDLLDELVNVDKGTGT